MHRAGKAVHRILILKKCDGCEIWRRSAFHTVPSKCTFTFKTCPRIHMRNPVLISRSLSNSSLKNISFSTLRKRNSSSKVPVSLSIPYVVESTSRSEVLTTLTSSNFFLLPHLESFRYFFSSFKRPNCVSEWNRS